ncbi:DNA cytosine methyltransferase [Burkholderia vietnamiensis]|uniref:DNA cytosine methyltransferase n=1 Tax=Burkholderia vietnamiensis TaxID=60552 RepID=UPI001BA26DD5|nr:DNA cytosine methyltransferase [Burkholderia vietnamiensis]MBR7920212.1 DNA cytosine methyltransferase [Burkholderia vietnamiensis]MBR8205299.1 DNA cytosine methyltransferase [Burkholderia vietnamiensis]HDR9133222.1 DNA cytosine methyltransferase [Burkholderia vietnamiensis]
MIRREYKVFTMCSGLGGGAKGFQEAMSQVGEKIATWRCIGGIDNDPAACRDFKSLVGVDCTLMDLFTRAQYTAFNVAEPPEGWREVTPDDVRRAAGYEHPHCVFISSPCKGASGLLSETLSRTPKYQALNELTLRCVWLMCEAWKDDPVELIVFENVPRLANRGRHLLDQIGQILRHYGYAVNETTHDCGEIGALAQSRKRFLLVARHAEKVPAFLYEPSIHRLQGVGTVLGRMPMPGDSVGGPMHRIPSLQWKTWVRLAFVEAGSDWRSLNKLTVENGHLRDYLIVPDMHNDVLGVNRWDEPMGVVAGASRPGNGTFSVADPRGPADAAQYQQYGVLRWGEHAGTITGQKSPGQGTFSVADPRTGLKHNNCFRVVPFEEPAGVVTGGTGPSAGGQAVADPRPPAGPLFSKYKVTDWNGHAGTVIGGDDQGAYAVADPRPNMRRDKGDNYLTGGHYGVVGWEQSSGAVSAAACHDNGRWSVADPRLPAANEKTIAMIRALDGTWHRPFTTLELAALQSLVEPEEQLELDGLSDQAWRERIGNAVPPKAAKAVAEVMGTTLLLAESGETFMLSSTPVWVRSVAIALSLPSGDTQ